MTLSSSKGSSFWTFPNQVSALKGVYRSEKEKVIRDTLLLALKTQMVMM